MTADDFVKAVRSGNEKLRVDNVVVDTGSVKLRGRGILRINPDRIEIDLTLSGRKVPPPHPRVVTKKDQWKLTGLIEHHLRFRCDNVSPGGRAQSFNGILKITRSLHPIELVEKPVNEKSLMRKRMAREKRLGFKPLKPSSYALDRSFSFEATLIDCELPAANSATTTVRKNAFLKNRESFSLDTFTGELPTCRYAFIRSKNESDLDIYFRSKPKCKSIEKRDWRKFRALLDALAFATGVQPWPFRIKYMRNGYRISERITAAQSPSKTSLSPFRRALGSPETEYFSAGIRAAATFLEHDTLLNNKLTHLLFLFREAGKEHVQLEIRILATCAILESLVRTIFKEVCNEQSGSSDAVDPVKFQKSKDALLAIAAQTSNGGRPNREQERLCDRIKDASVFQTQDIFKAVAHRLDISWENQMRPLFAEWKRARNPSVHGSFQPQMDAGPAEQKAVEQMFFGLSRIAGGFNMILLKLFGYSGIYRASALEDVYRQL